VEAFAKLSSAIGKVYFSQVKVEDQCFAGV